MSADTINPSAPDPIRAAEFVVASNLMVEGSVTMYRAAMWSGNDHAIAEARANAEKAFSQNLDYIEAHVVAQRMNLRKAPK
ncbi:hypothetical protein [Azospirillum sp. TSO5]|uniref:hypothetical protein n=1 Tax=Azospirillum sp. TSO5 TaxID=716760 RepID=UPI000D6150C2|nr:hypothetical protein [Azospirillum sp. TSO5]PWC98038.1 hypothetical protein TSO5_03265 [Azospirillum sp. TSO5]